MTPREFWETELDGRDRRLVDRYDYDYYGTWLRHPMDTSIEPLPIRTMTVPKELSPEHIELLNRGAK